MRRTLAAPALLEVNMEAWFVEALVVIAGVGAGLGFGRLALEAFFALVSDLAR